MKKVIKKGHADWADLIGKNIQFEFWAPWEDSPWTIQMKFNRTDTYHEDPRYPRYYILDEDGGGYSFWEDEEVEVTILEDANQH